MNELVWLLATAPDASVRNGAEALKLASDVCVKNGWKKPTHIDTLAAAYAELDQWDQAITTEQKAIALLSEEPKKNAKLLE